MKTFTFIFFFFCAWICPSSILFSQTCCSGGVPVSSNIGFSNAEIKTLQLSLNANFNTLKTLFSFSDKLIDDQRKRTTQSYLIRGHYTFTDRFAVEGFFSFIRQTREIFSRVNEPSDFESSFGVGDPILLATYRLTSGSFKWTIGAGPQIPLGSFTETNSRGLFLVEDLQPGSGSWDIVLISLFELPLTSRPSTTVFGRSIFDFTGSNSDSRNGRQTYTFGNDYQFIAGISDQLFVANNIIYPSLSVRYRQSNRDAVDGNETSGTGGKWLFGKASLGIEFFWETRLSIDVELPFYTFVNDTQLSPNSIINVSIHKTFSFDKNKNSIINF